MNFLLLDATAIDEEAWDQFVNNSPQGSPYTLYQTLRIIHPGWQAIVCEEDGKWQAVFPFPVKKKYGITYCFQLPWTQHSGILLAPFDLKESSRLDKVKKIICGIVELAKSHCMVFDFALSPEFDYPLPFRWLGFELTPRYTYRLDLMRFSKVEENFSSKTNNTIRKAVKAGYTVQPAQNISEVIRIYKTEIGNKVPHLKHDHYVKLESLIRYMLQNDRAIVLEARCNNILSGGTVLYLDPDKKTAYFPLGVTNPEAKAAGAMSLLLSEAMTEARNLGYAVFDFEGSVIEEIERFFRGFGASPRMYTNISRYPKWLKLVRRI